MVSHNRVRVQHGDVVYESITAAVEATGMDRNVLNKLCKTPETSGWRKLNDGTRPQVSFAGSRWVIDGVEYRFSKIAACVHNVSSAQIRHWMNDPARTDCYMKLADGTHYKNTAAHARRLEKQSGYNETLRLKRRKRAANELLPQLRQSAQG